MMEQAKAMGIPTPLIDGFQREMEKAIGQQISKAAKKVENFVERNETAPNQISQAPGPAPDPQLQGYLMEVTEQNRPKPKESSQIPGTGEWDALWVSLPVL